MLKRHKNAFLHVLQRSGYGVADFTTAEDIVMGLSAFTITFRDTELWFMVRSSNDSHDQFDCKFSTFHTGFPETEFLPSQHFGTFSYVETMFVDWLKDEVSEFVADESMPDLWAAARAQHLSVTIQNSAEFEVDEKEQIKLQLKEFRRLVEKTFEPVERDMATVNDQIDYLSNAVDRLNRFDWNGVALSTLINITVALSLDTERGKVLYGLFQQAMVAISHLLRGT